MEEKKPNIIFIDDEVRILRSLNSIFRRSYNVFATTDPKEFLALIQQHHMHVVVSDQRMPRVRGTELLAKVKKISPSSMRILLTGYADVSAILDSVNEGEIYRYITKPWQADELRETIHQAAKVAYALEAEKNMPNQVSEGVGESSDGVELETILALFKGEKNYRAVSSRFAHKYNVLWANDLEKAAQLLEEHTIAVIISDVHFGDDDTVAVVNELKKASPQTVSVIISSRQDANILIDMINKGQIFRFLINPVSGYLLDKSIRHAIKKHHQLKESKVEQQRFAVDDIGEEAQSKQSSIMSGFISRLRRHFST